MSMTEQLARTILLFQNDLGIADPAVVLGGLTAPTILIVADAKIVSSHSGQVAITTAAMLMARSGHSVFVDIPDAPLIGEQPPLRAASLHDAIAAIGCELIDGVQIAVGCPLFPADIAFVFGSGQAGLGIMAKRLVSVGWTKWAGEICAWPLRPDVSLSCWPLGAMAAATLVACEALKISGRLLTKVSPHAEHFHDLFAPSKRGHIRLAPEQTRQTAALGDFDVISGGAVSNALMYALFRIQEVSGNARLFEGDVSESSNRNRNMLLSPAFLDRSKLDVFEHFQSGLTVDPVRRHFSETDLADLRPRVAVGVDDISARWMLANGNVAWMGVGATSHFSALASVHYPYAACVACLHPHDEVLEGPTPTTAPVSFLAGLMIAASLLEDLAGDARPVSSCRYITPLRPEEQWFTPVPAIAQCPAACRASRKAAA